MTRVRPTQISSADTAKSAEYKAAMAETALCEALCDHFRRVLALITHARSTGHEEALTALYPPAFAVAEIDAATAAAFTTLAATTQAATLVDELTLGIHALDWESGAGPDAEPELLRKSIAVVKEANSIDRLRATSRLIAEFDAALGATFWAARFIDTHPSPLGKPST